MTSYGAVYAFKHDHSRKWAMITFESSDDLERWICRDPVPFEEWPPLRAYAVDGDAPGRHSRRLTYPQADMPWGGGAPKMNERARAVLEPLIRDWVQILPLECLNTGPHWLINCLAYLPGVADMERSPIQRHPSGYISLDREAGLVLNPPLDGAPWPPIFKVEPFDTDVYVSGEFKRRYDEAQLTGLNLKPIRIVER